MLLVLFFATDGAMLKWSHEAGESGLCTVFTSTAVAWFTAGVITPVFVGAPGVKIFLLGVTGVVTALFFLNLAVQFARRK